MKSPISKRSIIIEGHRTSVSLEGAFWKALKDIAAARGTTLSKLTARIDSERRHDNLSSAIRLFVLDYFQTRTHDRMKRLARGDGPPRRGPRTAAGPTGTAGTG